MVSGDGTYSYRHCSTPLLGDTKYIDKCGHYPTDNAWSVTKSMVMPKTCSLLLLLNMMARDQEVTIIPIQRRCDKPSLLHGKCQYQHLSLLCHR